MWCCNDAANVKSGSQMPDKEPKLPKSALEAAERYREKAQALAKWHRVSTVPRPRAAARENLSSGSSAEGTRNRPAD
jgi:hypothetical protein